LTGHAISGNNDIGGNNHFLNGNNIFDNFNIIEQLSTYQLSAEQISAGTISADWTKVKHTSGYSLFDLSIALSNKIWIDDQVNNDIVNHTSDLSIVKIGKDVFD